MNPAPHNLDAERFVLGSILIAGVSVEDVSTVLSQQDFHDARHQEIFQAMLDVSAAHSLPVVPMVAERLRAAGRLDWVGEDTIFACMESVTTAASWRHYAGLVRELSIRRQMRHTGMQMIERSEHPAGTVDEALAECERDVLSIRRMDQQDPEVGEAAVRAVLDDLHERHRNPGVRGLLTGYRDLDEKLGGLKGGDMVILAARPSMGKTAALMNALLNVAAGGRYATMFSLEMKREVIIRNALCCVAGVDAHRAGKGHITTQDIHALEAAGPKLSRLLILDPASCKASTVVAYSRRLHAKYDLAVIGIDYLGLMYTGTKTRYEDAGDASRTIKHLARELGIPIILLCQLNRATARDERKDKRPNLADLRDCGNIEEDADVVMFVHRPGYYTHGGDPAPTEIIVAKNRLGPTGTVNLKFQPECLRFSGH